MAPGLAEQRDHQVRGAVDHLGYVEETLAGLHEAAELDHLADPTKIAVAGRGHLGDQVDRAQPRGSLAGGEVEIGPDHAAS